MSCDRCERDDRVHVDGKHLCTECATLDPGVVSVLRWQRLANALDACLWPLMIPVLLVQQVFIARRAKKLGLASIPHAWGQEDRRLEFSSEQVSLFVNGQRRWTSPVSSLRRVRIAVPDTPELEASYDPTLCFVTHDGVEWRFPSSVPGWTDVVNALKQRRLIEPGI